MLAKERHRVILSKVQSAGSVRVAALAQELAVTEETIRRDLERLDNEGKLQRIHGGAVTIEHDRRELPLGIRETVHIQEKRAIAEFAARYVADGDVIALDASSTAGELAKALFDFSLTVVTNSVAVAMILADRSRIRVISTGGVLDAPSLSYVGPIAEQTLERFHINKLFFSCKGLDLERGLSVTADEHAGIKRRMLDLCEKAYLLIDGSKFGVRAVEFFGQVRELDHIITDTQANPATVEKLRAMGIDVNIAD
ncbi:MAG: DeoR/GlpR family DNA-binding transcription regulator [Phycisphaerales bacterium]